MTWLVSLEAHAEEAANVGPTPAPVEERSAPTAAAAPPQPAVATEVSMMAHASTDVVGPHYRSPGLSVALSLTPIPIDFGNLYAENIVWGAVYSTAEIALMTPMMWLAGGHMHHGNDGDRTWSTEERGWAIGLVTGYVLVKIASGVHAGFAAASFNREHDSAALLALPSVATVPGGAVLGMQREF